MSETFSVYQWVGLEGTEPIQECVRRNVTAEEAMSAFKHYTQNVAARMGITARVIITDEGDYTAAEWERGKGYVFPPELVASQRKRVMLHDVEDCCTPESRNSDEAE